MLTRRGLMAGATLALGAGAAQAQTSWPDRPVRIIVGYPAGGPTDYPARLLQDPLAQLWGQPIVIENRPGASSLLATEFVAKAAPDGATILMAASVHASNPAVYQRLPYDTLRDFAPIVCIYSSPTVLMVAQNAPWRTVQDLVAEMRRTPGMLNATSGNGASGHFAAAMFGLRNNIDITNVAYRGAAPAFQDVMTGRVPMSFGTLSGALTLIKGEKLRVLAICAPQRMENILPGVPTLDEIGLGIPDTSPWYGFIGPAALPRPIVDRIAADTQGLLRRPEIAQRITEQGGVLLGEGPDKFAERIRREMAETAEVARRANIRNE